MICLFFAQCCCLLECKRQKFSLTFQNYLLLHGQNHFHRFHQKIFESFSIENGVLIVTKHPLSPDYFRFGCRLHANHIWMEFESVSCYMHVILSIGTNTVPFREKRSHTGQECHFCSFSTFGNHCSHDTEYLFWCISCRLVLRLIGSQLSLKPICPLPYSRGFYQ